jgi:septum formation protein
MERQLVLASSSPYRRELLKKLGLNFSCESPAIDESPLAGESAQQLVVRLAIDKAKAVAANHPDALIIASDQVALFNGKILGKPGNHLAAKRQLAEASGNEVLFLTSLVLLDTSTGMHQHEVVPYTVHFRTLNDIEIEGYLLKEQPYDCAGSFKSEGLGITLFNRLEGDDPTALIGLPLIKLSEMLINEGLSIY